MSPSGKMPDEFEQQARVALESSVGRIDGRIRSRLNQARHAALEAAAHKPAFWRRFTLMPAAGAVAAAVMVAFVLWPHSPGELPWAEGGHTSVEDLDLLADGDGLEMVSSEEADGAFFEWAVEQSDSNEST